MSRMRRGPLLVLLILLVSMTMGSASASQPIVQSDSNTMDLRLGANGTSEMNIGPGASIGIAINVTNLASSARSVDVTIRDTDAWAWEFNGMNSTGANATIRLEPNELEWIRFNVTAPFVRNGTPRAGTGSTFTVEASTANGTPVTWNVSFRTMQARATVLDIGPPTDPLFDPDQVRTYSLRVRNTGNDVDGIELRILELDVNGNTIPHERTDRFETASGWSAALFDPGRATVLPPNGSRDLQLSIESPDLREGELHLAIQMRPTGYGAFQTVAVTHPSVQWLRSSQLDIMSTTCDIVRPNGTCELTYRLQNTGNHQDTFPLQLFSSNDLILPDLQPIELDRGQEHIETIRISMGPDAMAGNRSDVVLGTLNGTEASSTQPITVETGRRVAWVARTEAQRLEDGILTLSMTLENLGNDEDGLIVRVSTSEATSVNLSADHAFEPTMDLAGDVRLIHVETIAPGGEITLTSLITLPVDANVEGMLTIEMEATSRLDEQIELVHSSEISYGAAPQAPTRLVERATSLLSVWTGEDVRAVANLVLAIGFASSLLFIILRRNRTPAPNAPAAQQQDWRLAYQRSAEHPSTTPDVKTVRDANDVLMDAQDNGPELPAMIDLEEL